MRKEVGMIGYVRELNERARHKCFVKVAPAILTRRYERVGR